MRRPRISSKLRAKIAKDARYRCGYCLMQQIATNWLLEVEHLIPTALGGTDDEETSGLVARRGYPSTPKLNRVDLFECGL